MKQLIRLMGVLLICGVAVSAAFAGTEMYSGKESKAVAPAPLPECNWTGFYIGLNGGGYFGHRGRKDLAGYKILDTPRGDDNSGVAAGRPGGSQCQWNSRRRS